ncbi:MAG TPA: methylated-DNA--[protein]-cysteine S-methyltransferase [Gaiellaceae bacterium]|nr:methylated-DNA--[protein]-cysteine S-methyltransferase [Gaiellaceae bacterium]
MKPILVQYDAPGWGVGEVWLDEDGRVFHSELPRPKKPLTGSDPGHVLAGRLVAYFDGAEDEFLDVDLVIPDNAFYAECARILRAVPRGEVITYGELAAQAGYARAARAAGTFCARCDLAPFLPVHRVVSANGIGSWGSQGNAYKRRMLEMEGVVL